MPAWTPEQAREFGRRGGRASAASKRVRASRSPRELTEAVFSEHAEALARELLKAAGILPPDSPNPYAELKGNERAALVVKALEFGVGRPAPGRAAKSQQPGRDVPTPGLNIVPADDED